VHAIVMDIQGRGWGVPPGLQRNEGDKAMGLSKQTIVVVLVAVAILIGAGVAMRGQGGGFLSHLAAIHGH
jgi:hypothetical protein